MTPPRDYHIPLWEQRENARQVRIVAINVALAVVAVVAYLALT